MFSVTIWVSCCQRVVHVVSMLVYLGKYGTWIDRLIIVNVSWYGSKFLSIRPNIIAISHRNIVFKTSGCNKMIFLVNPYLISTVSVGVILDLLVIWSMLICSIF
jgi:hypothetical protein